MSPSILYPSRSRIGLVPTHALLLTSLALAGCGQLPATDESSARAPEEVAGEAAQAAAATCVTFQRGGTGAVADALLNAAQPTRNFGATGSLTAGMSSGTQRQALLAFDLSSLLPGTTVTSATLNLNAYMPSGTAKPVRIHRALSPWTESAVTWSGFAGAYAAPVEAQIQPAAAFSWTATDVTALVQQWVSGAAPNHGMLLERDLDGSTVYGSSESPQLPSLQVCFIPPFCQGKADGTVCDDGDACTVNDACQGQVCAGAPVTCAAPDACHTAGACSPATGQCSYPAKADGTSCDDANACTSGDSCQSGACTGAAVTCTPPDPCQSSAGCSTSTGCSFTNLADGTSCTNPQSPSTPATCQAGHCTLLPAGSSGNPSQSCATLRAAQPTAPSGLYWIAPLGGAPTQVWCDMASGGWTLVYRATNSGGLIENGLVTGPGAIGTTPFTPSSTGQYKLADSLINALRSSTVANNLKVAVYINHVLLSQAWHPTACAFQGGADLPASDVCNRSTRTGPNATDYIQSGHHGMLTRWYVDGSFGYILPWTHIGPISGGTSHGGNLPPTYCTWYDSRTCPTNSQLEIWAY